MNLSVIIPTLNEEAWLPRLLADLQRQQEVTLEVIVADGGSTDRTLDACRPYEPIIVSAPRGRARQLNAGFKASTGENLLFLHADSRIEDPYLLRNALRRWESVISTAGSDAVAGHFPLKFVRSGTGNAMSFRYMEGKTHFNRVNTTNGDQGFLLKRSFFEKLGGFDEGQEFLEDQKLAEKIRRHGIWITLPGRLLTSGRRFEAEGVHRRYTFMSMIMALHTTGRMEFFDRAKKIYASQGETGHLRLKPYFKAVATMFIKDLGFFRSFAAWFYIGRYIRQNSWQMFYFFDVLLGTHERTGRYPLLAFHDTCFWPLTDNSLCDAITAMVSFVWFMLVLAPYYTVVDSLWPEGCRIDPVA
ncbi:MAG: TIGR04283 family arsenosugar biosynthesis glycosyltransferase [Pseudomonadota bacterium]